MAWKIALGVQKILEDRWGADVYLTKKAANDPSSDELYTRYNKANNLNADVFVSIHLNGAASEQANGTETFYYPGSNRGLKLATSIHKQVINCLKLTDRGVKTETYAVLRYTDMPAALVEVCFLSNLKDEQFITSMDNIHKASEAIAQGIVDYFYA